MNATMTARDASPKDDYCCGMSRKFNTGIVQERDVDMPTEACDFIMDWRPLIDGEHAPVSETGSALPSRFKGDDPDRLVQFVAKFCPWCGAEEAEASRKRYYKNKYKGG